ncbi:hypothetical protein QEG98_29530 [Myxococcus sp. MxC21-1]|uniref:ChbG/HpnK family deacetylase n=1 Tax=Myxococcus sp. MxC21-1 TaxID=3041439 RepID=UPI0029317762|nr:ChbG/HpnK family deacetylase [Myxococcus sp. MxC21-1]WNZ60127.1 hypothetical protein QEG98_29530 [Myxococcus sp. MxC21-1]
MKASVLAVLARAAPRAPKGVRRVSAGGVFEAGMLDEAALLAVVDTLPAGDFELGCHPGEGTPHVPEDPAWRYGWQAELAALTSARVKARLHERGIELHSYGTLFSAT